MGRASRRKPKHLARKLLQIRRMVDGGLTQEEFAQRLGLPEIDGNYISKYERDVLEPSLPTLLAVSRLANVYLEVLADDDLLLPGELPAKVKSEGIKKHHR
jgi:transcriptional regulator with XRE-family HTH domain